MWCGAVRFGVLLLPSLLVITIHVIAFDNNISGHAKKETYWKICKIALTRPLTSDKIGIAIIERMHAAYTQIIIVTVIAFV